MSEKSAYTCRDLREQDAEAVRALFGEVFSQEMSPEFWLWKYGNAQARGMLVHRGERLVAYYGGMGRQVLWCGRESRAVQITDVMVAPAARHSVRSGSPFYLAFTEFARRYLGYGRDFPLAFGFPSHRAFSLARHLGFYAPVGAMTELRWPARRSLRARLLRRRVIDAAGLERARPAIERCWSEMRVSLDAAIVGVRDADWIARRYLRHPVRDYQLLLCSTRVGGRPVGLLVLRHEANRSFLMDIVAATAHIPQLLNAARDAAARQGREELYTWCASGFASRFEVGEYRSKALPITVPANVWTEGPAPEELRDRWWLMPGDTDFQ